MEDRDTLMWNVRVETPVENCKPYDLRLAMAFAEAAAYRRHARNCAYLVDAHLTSSEWGRMGTEAEMKSALLYGYLYNGYVKAAALRLALDCTGSYRVTQDRDAYWEEMDKSHDRLRRLLGKAEVDEDVNLAKWCSEWSMPWNPALESLKSCVECAFPPLRVDYDRLPPLDPEKAAEVRRRHDGVVEHNRNARRLIAGGAD